MTANNNPPDSSNADPGNIGLVTNDVARQQPMITHQKKVGMGGLVVFVGFIFLLVGSCKDKKTNSDSAFLEEKIAFLDYGEKGKDPTLVAEYKQNLEVLAARFEISEKDVADATYIVVEKLVENGGSATTLQLLRSARKVAMSSNGDILGKGRKNYSFLVASIAAQLIPQ